MMSSLEHTTQLVVLVGHLQESLPLAVFLAIGRLPCAPPHVYGHALYTALCPTVCECALPPHAPLYVNVAASGRVCDRFLLSEQPQPPLALSYEVS